MRPFTPFTCARAQVCSITFVSVKNIHKVVRVWSADSKHAAPPEMPKGKGSVRATLRAPPWTAEGYSADSKGFVWWFFSQRPEGPLFLHGEAILRAIQGVPAQATHVHLFSHRYARGKPEGAKDMLTYHSAILLEWSHGRHLTVRLRMA